MKKLTVCLALMIAALVAAPAMAQHEGGGESGGSSGCGDVLGDLIHILRSGHRPADPGAAMGQCSRSGGYGWDYCPIAVDKNGQPIPFVALSCDPYDPTGTAVVPVDYFGRLSGGRTKERNSRMHFNEVISNIKMAGGVTAGRDRPPPARLHVHQQHPVRGVGRHRLADGEPGALHPADEVRALPDRSAEGGHVGPRRPDDAAPSTTPPSTRRTGPSSSPPCRTCCRRVSTFSPDPLTAEDFVSAGAFLGGAANKTGKITVDLVQYMNRILKITKKTGDLGGDAATSLPALVLDCWAGRPADPPRAADEGRHSCKDPTY